MCSLFGICIFFSSDNNSVQSHTKHCKIVPAASLDDSSLDQDEETITNAQEVSLDVEKVNFLESQSEIEIENGVIGNYTIPSPQGVADSPEIVSKIEPGSSNETISTEDLSDALKFSFEGSISKGVRENREGNEKVTATKVGGEKLPKEIKTLGIVHSSTLEGKDVDKVTPESSHKRENSQVKDFRGKVIDSTDIDVFNFKDENFTDHGKHTNELRTIEEVKNILSEEEKESGECLELSTISAVEAEILSEEEKESGECLELRTISAVEAEILSEEEKESGEGFELRTMSETCDFVRETSVVKHDNEEVVYVAKEPSNIQEVALKENHICKDVDDFANLEEMADEVGEMFSKEMDNMVQELSTDRERVNNTTVGEILLNEEVSSSASEKMCLKSAYESYPGIERSRAVKDNKEDRWDAPECLQEEKSVSLVIGDFTVEYETEGKYSLTIKEGLDVEITDALKTKEKNEPKNPKKIASQTALDTVTENIHETVLEVAYKTEADAGEVKSFVETPTYDSDTDYEIFKLKAKKEVDHWNTRSHLLEQQSVNIVMSEHALEEESVDDQDFSDNGKMLCKIMNKLVIDVKNQPPDKNLKAVISANVLGVENSGNDGYQILNSTEQPSHNLDDKTSIKHCSIGLNASAKEFVPRKNLTPESIFRGADGGPPSQRDSKQNGAKRNPENASRLNAEAKEYIPPLQSRVWKNRGAGNSQSYVCARDFVPSYVNNAPFQARFVHQMNHAPSMRPVYRPASPDQVLGFRQRGHARMHHRRPSGRFPPNQPRMRFRHQNPPNTVR